ncbi:succinate dehydrogenase assembly factor 4 [Azospirillum sp. HJ39]|uniref:DUF1674 domain-containing protein n=1 Tax=Azospirillum sp. HJ39 TaxID=3159496 RepID=UPI003557DDC1
MDRMTDQTRPDPTVPAAAAKDVTEKTEATAAPDATEAKGPEQKPGEIGGPKGPEPTRYGDWEFKGRCSDF